MTESKRIIAKVGFVYEAKTAADSKVHLQLVAIDQANLNSDIVAVFKGNNLTDDDPEKIAQAKMVLYAHTTVSQGVRKQVLRKIGKAPVYLNTDDLVFKYRRDQEHVDSLLWTSEILNDRSLRPPFSEPYWDIWKLGDKNWHSVSDEEGRVIEAQPGTIFSSESLLRLIGERLR